MAAVLRSLPSGGLRALRHRPPATGPPDRLRRWLERGRTRSRRHLTWRDADATWLAGHLRAIVGARPSVRRWRARTPLPATYLHPVAPEASDAIRATAARLLEGRFTPHRSVPERRETLPPRWDEPDDSRRTEHMYRHSLGWLEPLIVVAHADEDETAWAAATRVVVSWIERNSRPPGRSAAAWHDHAVAIRARVLCWFFELYRQRPEADASVMRLLVASIHQHALFLADPATYTPRSNHALETNGSLLAVCVTVPELRAVGEWERLARRRLERYVADAFTDDGFSKEQSPRYHFFVLRWLAALVTYLETVGRSVPPALDGRLRQATAVWPWLVRADGSLPRVGDTNAHAIPGWRRSLRDATTAELPPPCPSTIRNPRSDGAALLVSFDAGYAVLAGHHPGAPPEDDTHVLFKCNYFRFPHFHRDGLSFVLYALGREWLIDPGPHSYEYDRWERRYLCSSSAHNTVEVGARFDVHPVEFVDASRTATDDRVTVRHRLGYATHARTLQHRPPRHLRIVDDVAITDGETRDIRQLFHVHPDLATRVTAAGRLELHAPDGARCVITQAHDGVWRTVRGQRFPEPLGWRSPRQLAIEPITTCSYGLQAAGVARFETTIEIHPPTAA